MKHLRIFDQYNFYDEKWQQKLPEEFTIIYKDELLTFKKRANPNILPHQIQIKYDQNKWGEPDTLELDIEEVFDNNQNKIKLIISITYGDLEVAGFSIEPPNKIPQPFTYTSYGSKFDPSNTIFALTDESLNNFCNYINSFDHGIHINSSDLYFLKSNYRKI